MGLRGVAHLVLQPHYHHLIYHSLIVHLPIEHVLREALDSSHEALLY